MRWGGFGVSTRAHPEGLPAPHLNAPRVVLNSSNQIRWRWISDPWGQLPPETNPQSLGAFTLNLRLPGQVYDIESNLHYNYFRDYSPETGRYVQSDPIGLQGGINTYAYVGGNPLTRVDPEGLAWRCTRVGLVTQCAYVPDLPLNPDYPIDPGQPTQPLTWPKLLPDSWVDWIIDAAKGDK
jgi:RHS repeat-associated protein